MVHNRKISQGLFTIQAYLGLILSGSSQSICNGNNDMIYRNFYN